MVKVPLGQGSFAKVPLDQVPLGQVPLVKVPLTPNLFPPLRPALELENYTNITLDTENKIFFK